MELKREIKMNGDRDVFVVVWISKPRDTGHDVLFS